MKVLIYAVALIATVLSGVWSKQFTLEIVNQLKDPMFQHSFQVPITKPGNKLIDYMEMAAKTNPEFTGFVIKYYTEFGYFVHAVNDVYESYFEDGKSWALVDGNTGNNLNVGISTYNPKDGDYIIIELVQYQLPAN